MIYPNDAEGGAEGEDHESEEEEHAHNHHRYYGGSGGAGGRSSGGVHSADHDINDLSAHHPNGDNDLLADLGISANGHNGTISNMKWRAKLYQLNSKGSWDDFGTGEFQIVRDVSSHI